MTLFFFGKRTLNNSGIGMLSMIKSDETLNTVLVMRWLVAAEHCSKTWSVLLNGHFNRSRHTRIWWNGPILIERPTPYTKIKDLHGYLLHE